MNLFDIWISGWMLYVMEILTTALVCPDFSGFMILVYFFETYLDLRQRAALKLPTLPKTLVGVISQEKFEKSRAYSLDKRFVLYCN